MKIILTKNEIREKFCFPKGSEIEVTEAQKQSEITEKNITETALKDYFEYWNYKKIPEFKQIPEKERSELVKSNATWGDYVTHESNGISGKIFIPDTSDMVGKKRYEVFKILEEKYKNTHKLAGIEYQKWLVENPKEAPEELKDSSKWFYLPGTSFCYTVGYLNVPCVSWDGSRFGRYGRWLGGGWDSRDRVVFLEIVS